jgi:hypothetical protein
MYSWIPIKSQSLASLSMKSHTFRLHTSFSHGLILCATGSPISCRTLYVKTTIGSDDVISSASCFCFWYSRHPRHPRLASPLLRILRAPSASLGFAFNVLSTSSIVSTATYLFLKECLCIFLVFRENEHRGTPRRDHTARHFFLSVLSVPLFLFWGVAAFFSVGGPATKSTPIGQTPSDGRNKK